MQQIFGRKDFGFSGQVPRALFPHKSDGRGKFNGWRWDTGGQLSAEDSVRFTPPLGGKQQNVG
jgi:hypothetical protein